MRKTTLTELYADYGQDILNAHGRKRHPLWDTIDEIEVDQAVVFEREEWTLTARPSQMLNRHYVKDGRKFRTKRLQDGKIIIARIA